MKWYLHLGLILGLIFLVVAVRVLPVGLSVTDKWAEQTIVNNVRQNVASDILKDYPYLPNDVLQSEVDNRTKLVVSQNKVLFDESKKNLSFEFKERLRRDSDGMIYLGTIDTWYWYQLAEDYNSNGFMGNVLVNGSSYDRLMRGQHLHPTQFTFHPFSIAVLYKVVSFFYNGFSMMASASWISVVLVALGMIPLYLLGNRFAGWFGGLVAGLVVVFHPSAIVRSLFGVADTDAWHFLLPITAVWLFFESYYHGEEWVKYVLVCSSGVVMALHSTFWTGWVYIFDIILGTLLVSVFFWKWKKVDKWKGDVNRFTFLVVSTCLSGGLFTFVFNKSLVGFGNVVQAITLPLWFIQYKSLALTDLFPNVLTTVAELNGASFGAVVMSVSAILFFGAVLGIVLEFFVDGFNVKYGVFLSLWLLATVYASLNGLRFTALLLPCLAVALGCCAKILWSKFPDWFDDFIGASVKWTRFFVVLIVVVVLGSLAIRGVQVSMDSAPMMCDGWYNTLTYLRDYSAEDSVVTTWWDFGHWIKAVGRRSVTFDGGDQEHRIYWVGKLFLSSDERESLGILRMLNCDQTEAYNKLKNFTGDTVFSVDVLNKVLVVDKLEATGVLKGAGLSDDQVGDVLLSTHCVPVEQYVITSSDMIGKAPVWSYFGSWNFSKALNKEDAGVHYGYQSVSPVVASYPLNESLFTKLHLQPYNGTAFSLVRQERTIYGDVVDLWKVNWEVLD